MTRLAALALVLALVAPAFAAGEGDEDGAVPDMMTTGGLVLYYDSTGPMSFVTMTPKDVPSGARLLGEVSGESCQRGLSVPIAVQLNATSLSGVYGDGGYRKALEAIKKAHPDLAGIYDVKTDLELFSILGVYRTLCTVVAARGFAKN